MSKLSRRSLLIGTAATVAAASIPLVSSLYLDPKRSIAMFSKHYDNMRKWSDKHEHELINFSEAIMKKTVTDFPHLFPFQNIKTNITDIIRHNNKYSTVPAISRYYKAEYSLELAQDLKCIVGIDPEETLIEIISAEIGVEIELELASYTMSFRKNTDLDFNNVLYLPYIPVIATRAININAFQPIVRFKSRYGIISDNPKYYSSNKPFGEFEEALTFSQACSLSSEKINQKSLEKKYYGN